MNTFLLYCLLSSIQYPKPSVFANSIKDTTIVGQIIGRDSIFENPNFLYTGIKYYYGVYHLKVAVFDIANPDKARDTLILAYVYNKLTETPLYKRGFDLNLKDKYIFYVHQFKPCRSDFPRIQGSCSSEDYFFPESNKLIKKYKSISRIIFATKYQQ